MLSDYCLLASPAHACLINPKCTDNPCFKSTGGFLLVELVYRFLYCFAISSTGKFSANIVSSLGYFVDMKQEYRAPITSWHSLHNYKENQMQSGKVS